MAITGKTKAQSEGHEDITRKQAKNQAVPASFLTFAAISSLENTDELYSTVKHIIEKHGHSDESVKRTIDKKTDTITYEMVEKTLCLDIAHHVVDAFKHYHPQLEMHNPKDNQFYRITVKFND